MVDRHSVRKEVKLLGFLFGKFGGLANDVSRKRLAARHIVACYDDRAANTGMFVERRFDLAKLNAKASQLDLVVDSAEKLDIAFGKVAREIARSVHPRSAFGGERVRYELLRGQLRMIEIPARQSFSAYAQLTRYVERQKPMKRIEHMSLNVRDWLTDGRTVEFRPHAADRGVDRAFGRPIDIVELDLIVPREDLPGRTIDRLTSDKHLLKTTAGRFEQPAREQHAKMRWRAVEHAYSGSPNISKHRVLIQPDFPRNHVQRVPAEQLDKLLDRCIERDGPVHADALRAPLRILIYRVVEARQQIEHRSMLNQNTLGFAR